jgi:curved DNA-binding protein CbpA
LLLRGKLFRVTDAFAEFGMERRPWLDPAALQSRYHELAVIRHPDKCGGDPRPLSRLNEARRILSSPPLRLRHLLDLTSPTGPIMEHFTPDFEQFARAGSLAKRAEQISAQNASSPLAAAVARAGCASLQKEIAAALDRINLRLEALERIIQSLDASWPDVAPQDIPLLAEEFSFLNKWRQSLRSAQTRLVGG